MYCIYMYMCMYGVCVWYNIIASCFECVRSWVQDPCGEPQGKVVSGLVLCCVAFFLSVWVVVYTGVYACMYISVCNVQHLVFLSQWISCHSPTIT